MEDGFGVARYFMSLPHTVVGSHCTWQLRLNTVPARIPGTVPANNHPLHNNTMMLQKQSQRFSATALESNVGGQNTTTASR